MALAPALHATAIVAYVVDYSQTMLVPLDGAVVPRRAPIRVDGSVGGRTFTTDRPHQRGGRVGRLWLPLTSAVLAELDCATGELRLVIAGHPAPLPLRGGRLAKVFPAPTARPLGLGYLTGKPPGVLTEQLHAGDQLLLYTDGVIEAHAVDGELFGIERLVDLVTRALADRLSTPETMRRLVRAILRHQKDQLQDDATAMFVEWKPDRPESAPA